MRYTNKTARELMLQIEAEIPSVLPELRSNFIPQNFWYRLIYTWAFFIELVSVYLDKYAQNIHISTADNFADVIQIAYNNDYRIKGKHPASGVCKLSIFSGTTQNFSGLNIIAGTTVQSSNGFIYEITQPVVIPAQTGVTTVEAVFEVMQNNKIPLGFFGFATTQSEYILPEKIRHNSLIVHTQGTSITVWQRVDTFANSLYTDHHFVQDINQFGSPILRFGNGVQGVVPTIGDSIYISYIETEGLLGNIPIGNITDFVTPLSLAPFNYKVTNISNFVGGSDIESIDSIKRNVPLHNRSSVVCATKQDYVNNLKLHPAVKSAYLDDTSGCSSTVTAYIVGFGVNPVTQATITSVDNFIASKLLYNTTLVLKSVGVAYLTLDITVNAKPNSYASVVQTDVYTALATYLYDLAAVKSYVALSDLYQVVEAVSGVSNSYISSYSIVPTPVGINTTDVLLVNITYTTTNGHSDKYRVTFISNSQFYIYINNNYIGTYTVGIVINLPNLNLEVSSTHNTNDIFEFHSYPTAPISGGIILLDYNLIELNNFINLTVTGGI